MIQFFGKLKIFQNTERKNNFTYFINYSLIKKLFFHEIKNEKIFFHHKIGINNVLLNLLFFSANTPESGLQTIDLASKENNIVQIVYIYCKEI